MVTAKQDVFFKLCVLHLVVLNQNVFSNCFDSVQFLLLNKFSEVNFAKSTSSKKHLQLEVLIFNIRVLSEAHKHWLSHICKIIYTGILFFLFLFKTSKSRRLTLIIGALIKIERRIINISLFASKLCVVFFLSFYLVVQKSLRVVGQIVNPCNLVFWVVGLMVGKQLLISDDVAPERNVAVQTIKSKFQQIKHVFPVFGWNV